MVVTKTSSHQSLDENWYVGENLLNTSDKTTHLGITRATKNENKINIEDRISLARRTLYSLIKTGVHGCNGLSPVTSHHIYKTYVLPRLLYGLETLNLNKSEIQALNRFHLKTLRSLQSLPQRTASSAVYLLLGALPIEAELHTRQLVFLYNIFASENATLCSVISRHYQLRDLYPDSFSSRLVNLLERYNLPEFYDVKSYSKLKWKNLVKQKVQSSWTSELTSDLHTKSSMRYCSIESLRIGKPHRIWKSVNNNVIDVRRGITKVRLLTGTYILQSSKHKFNQYDVDPACPLCRLEIEDVQHFLLRCPALWNTRRKYFPPLRELLVKKIGLASWQSNFGNKNTIVQLMLDCQALKANKLLPEDDYFLNDVEEKTRLLCHNLHLHRLNLIDKLTSSASST